MEIAYEMGHICAQFIYLSPPRLFAVNDSVFTHVERYSCMGGKESETESKSKIEIERE